jgi:hypothetical protein
MNKEFIPYEQALALKELSFDEPCFKGYTEEYKTLIAFSNTHTNTSVRNTLPTKPFTAPLYQQAFRWFREKYGLFVAPNAISYENGPYLWFFEVNSTILSFGIDLGETDDFENYEEAELACLIKLIEIVKNK